MFKIIDLEQDSPEWHEFRRTHIGASNCAAILGKSKYKSPYMVWEEMVRGKKTPSNAAMERGKRLEPEARAVISKLHQTDYQPIVGVSAAHDWQMASLDGWNGTMAIEIKCPGEKTMKRINDGDIPVDYLWQIQHQLAVTACERQFLFAYDGEQHHAVVDYDREKNVVVDIGRDEEMIAELIDKESEFYHKYILEFSPPPLQDLDVSLRQDEHWRETSEKYLRAKALSEQYEAEMQKHKKALISLSNGSNSRGAGITLTKYISQGRVDYSAIPELREIDLEKYRKESVESWRITS